MGFFTIGNLITLTIVILILLLYRQLDRKNRSLEKVRKFVDKVKEELDAYTDEKAVEVKNFGINLDVERKSALELMKRLQSLTEKDLAEKAAAIARIDERIHAYDTSLEELVRMTGRVQENLNRIRDESAFVEHAGRQVGEAKEKLNEMEKDLGGLLVRFEQENTEALNKAVEETLGAVKSTISNLETKAKTMALQVENHRETVEKVEQERKANLNKDIHTINTVLREAVEKAGTRADKMEETALIKLRDQAQDRVKRLQAAWEEKLKSTQETVKIRLAEIQEQFRSFRDEWKKEQGELEIQQKQYQESRKTEHEELETRQKQYREEWKKEIQNLNAQISRQNGEWNTAVSRQQENLNAAAARQQDEINTAMTRQREAFNAAIAKQQDEINAAITRQQEEVQKLDAQIGCQNGEWNTAVNRQQENLNAAAARQQDEINAAITRQREAFSAAIARQQDEINAAMTRQQEAWALITRDTEQRILAGSETQLEEYKRAQTEEFKQLAGLAGDVTRLDGELRLSMQETVNRVNADFISFEQEAARSREISAAEFTAQVTALKTEMDGVERELNTLKSQAYENVSEKLKLFEDDFFTDLNKRSGEIDLQLEEWHNGLENRLAEMAKTGEEEHREAVLRFNEEMRKTFTGQGERLTADLERLKAEAGAFEEGIREEMRAADETRQSLQEQLAQDLAEARRLAEDSAKNEIGRYSLSMAETLKQHQRELEEQLRGMTSQVEEKHHEITGVLEDSRRGMEEWQNNCTAQMRNLDASMDEARRRIRELVTENDERLVSVRASIEDIRKELSDETNLFDRAGKLRMELEQYIEDMGGTLDRLDQRRKEIAQLEDQLVQIKHLENDVNAKMTRFLSEKRRIEVMETDFNSLLQTSHEVEKKLAQVSSSDDTLQALQVQIRRLEDAIQETEKKYQRVEKKNQILEETNDGIARNFKALQESEETARQAGEELTRIAQEIDSLHAAVGVLAEDNGKARETIDKLGFLDESLTLIEKRISEMQTAREWLARTETRLAELDQQAQSQLRLTSSLLNKESGKPPASGTDTLPPRDRENIIKLHNQGWTIDQIAASYHRAKSEIELILEIGIRD